MRRLTSLFFVIILLALPMIGCDCSSSSGPDGDITDGDNDFDGEGVTSKEIGPDGGEISLDEMTVIFPEGALEETVEIIITEAEAEPSAFEVLGPIYEFTPKGLEFKVPVTVILPYDTEKAGGRTIAGFWTQLGDDTLWENLGGEAAESGRWRFQTEHFSLGAIGTLDMEDGDTDGDGPTLDFERGDSWNVTFANDSSVADGVQINIAMESSSIPAGTAVTLTVNSVAVPQQEVNDDGNVLFQDVTVEVGDNTLHASADVNGATVEADATVTLGGCLLVFTSPQTGAELSDAGGDCTETCGDDLDCNSPNLQYNVTLSSENIGAGNPVSLDVEGVNFEAQMGVGEVTFENVSLPHGETVTLTASAGEGDEACEAMVEINVELTCDCRLLVEPLPEDYNLSTPDDNADTEGFQKTYTATSENCLPGSTVSLNLDGGEPVEAPLGEDNTVAVDLTLPDGAHSLTFSVTETVSGRSGAAGPYEFAVDRTAPVITVATPEDGATITVNNDLDGQLGNGIQLQIAGTTSEEATEVTLTINGESLPEAAPVDAGNFSFESVSLLRPEDAEGGVPFELVLATFDAAGNPGSTTLNLTVYFDAAKISIATVGGQAVGGDLRLNASNDLDTGTAGLQTTVTATTQIVLEGAEARLTIDGGQALTTTVDADGNASWDVTLPYGQHTLRASADIAGGIGTVTSVTASLWTDATAPDVGFVGLVDGQLINTDVLDVTVYSGDAEAGQIVSLFLDDAPVGSPTAIDDGGTAVFPGIALPEFTEVTDFSFSASLTDYAGNPGSGSVTLTYDTFPPTVEVTVPPSPIESNENISVTVTVAGEPDGRNVNLKLFNIDNLQDPFIEDDLPLVSGSVNRTYTFLSDGNYRLIATYEDEAGNIANGQADLSVDTGCFTMAILTLTGTFSDGKYFYGLANAVNGVVSVNVTAEAVAPDPPPEGTEVQLFLNGSATPVATGAITADGNYTFQGIALEEGENTLEIVSIKGFNSCYASPRSVVAVVDFSAPTIALANPAMPDPPTDPLSYNAASTDTSGAAGFQSSFTYHSDDAGEGQPVTLTVSTEGYSQDYTANVDASGDATFTAVTLRGTNYPENQLVTLSATVSNLAGNPSDPVVVTALVDRSVPTFTNVSPPAGQLNALNDSEPTTDGLQLNMSFIITGGTPGQDVVTGTLTNNATPDAPLDIGPYDLGSGGVVNVSLTLEEAEYTLNFFHTDAFGNSGTLEVFYTVDFIALISMTDPANNNATLDGTTVTWNASRDLQPTVAGFQIAVNAAVEGFEAGTQVKLCSDIGRQDGLQPYGKCQHPDGTSYIAVDQKAVSPISGFAEFPNVGLVNNATHTLFVEAVDGSGNFANSLEAVITLDSDVPAAPTVAVSASSNTVTANDTGGNIVINGSEGAATNPVSDDRLVTFTVTTAASDVTSATLYVGQDSHIALINSGVATFSNIRLPNGFNGLVEATVRDDVSNTSERGNVSVVVDTIAPVVSFNGPFSLYQAQCGGQGINSDPCSASIGVTVAEDTNEQFEMAGGNVTLTGVATPKAIPSYAPATSVVLSFTATPIAQGSPQLTATATDAAGNVGTVQQTFTVDSVAPTLSFATPDFVNTYPAGRDYVEADDQGNGVSDLLLTRTEWQVLAEVVNNSTNLSLKWRFDADPAETVRVFPNAEASPAISATPATQTVDITALDFRRGDMKVWVTATESNGNTMKSGEVSVSVTFDPGMTLSLTRLNDEVINSGDKFGLPDETNAGDPDFNTRVKIVATNIADGEVPTFTLNGADLPVTSAANGNGQLAGGEVTYLLVLNETPGTNTFAASYTTAPPDSTEITTSVTNITADRTRPTITFTSPSPASNPHVYNATGDADSTQDGTRTLSTDIVVTCNDADLDTSKNVILKGIWTGTPAVDLQNIATTSWTGASPPYTATFSNVGLPNGHYNLYVDNVADTFGNALAALEITFPVVDVDDYPPQDVTDLTVCIGESTGASGYQTESASCGTYCDPLAAGEECRVDGDCAGSEICVQCNCISDVSATCGDGGSDAGEECGDPGTTGCTADQFCANCICVNDDSLCAANRCDRRGGRLTLLWTTPDRDENQAGAGVSGTGVDEYEVRYKVGTGATPCSGVTWATATVPSAGDVVYDTPYATVGATQAAELTDIDINSSTSICVLMRAIDPVDNYSETTTVREVLLYKDTLDTDVGSTNRAATDFATFIAWGNFNGDEYDDVVFSAPYNNSDTGEVYAYYGGAAPAAGSSWSETTATADVLGFGMDAGDLNGDGIDDLAIGAWFGVDYAFDGYVNIYFGQSGTGLPASPDVVLTGPTFSSFGAHVEIFDWDGDGIDDLFSGTWADDFDGSPVYMMKGRASWNATYDVTGAGVANLVIQREAGSVETFPAGPNFGFSLGHADIDNDGTLDLVIFDNDRDNGATIEDRFWVFWGGQTGLFCGAGVFCPIQVSDGANFHKVANQNSNGGTDQLVGVPDTNGDGLDEILLRRSGVNAVMNYHSSTGTPRVVAVDRVFRHVLDVGPPEVTDDDFGLHPYTALDFNMDGYGDVVMAGQGLVQVYWGGAVNLSPNAGYYMDISGLPASPNKLRAAGGGDYNNDGRPDLVVINRTLGDVVLIY